MTRPIYASIITALFFTACTPFNVQTPPGFVKLEETGHPYKAVSADGAVLAVRVWDNKPKAGAKFWNKVVLNELTNQRGYQLKDSRPISASGVSGERLHYEGGHRGNRFVYLLGLFVTDDRIFAVEGVAPAKQAGAHGAVFDKLLASFKPET